MGAEEWIGGRYRLDGVLGQGGMATVYRAWQPGLQRWVAIKRYRWSTPEELELFRGEARLLGSLHCPAVVTVHELIESADSADLVMELLQGLTLRQLVEQGRPDERQALRWMEEILDVLEFLHCQQPPIILKDLKPDNLMVEPSGRLRLVDFGIAKRLEPGGGTQILLKGVGSEHYAPLEQYGHGSTDQRSDFYALGATLYFMLTGVDPAPAWQRLAKHLELDPSQEGVEISPTTCHLVQQLTALFPQDRPGDETSIRQLLKSIGPGQSQPSSTVRGEVTRVSAPSPGQARALRAELLQRQDLSALLGDLESPTQLAWVGEQPELWVVGRRVQRIDVNAPKVLRAWGQGLLPSALAVSEDGHRVALATKDRTLHCWEGDGEPVSLPLEGASWRWLRFAGSHSLLAWSQGHDLAAYTFPTATRVRSFGPQHWWLRFSSRRLQVCQSSGPWLAAAASDGSLFLWEHANAHLLWQSHQPSPAICVNFSPEGDLLVSTSEDGTLSVWQTETGRRLLQVVLETPWQSFHYYGRALLGIEKETVVVWDFANARPCLRIRTPAAIQATALSSRGGLACLLEDGRLWVLDFDLS